MRCRPLPPLLRKLREAAGLTQRQLAARLRVTHAAVHKSETGERRVDVAEFINWCVACGADPDQAFRALRQLRGS